MDTGIKLDPSAIVAGTERGLSGTKSPKKTAEEFESFLIYTVLKEFQKAMNYTKKSYSEETQMSLFYEKAADALAQKGIGVKEVLTKYLVRGAQESIERKAKVLPSNGENT
jgi:Rod binding domain-containing protein